MDKEEFTLKTKYYRFATLQKVYIITAKTLGSKFKA